VLERIVETSIRYRLLVVLLAVVIVAAGAAAFERLSMDAVPDITTVQVQIATRTAPMSAADVERYVTYPVELAMTGLPRVEQIRSVSRFGLSLVTVVFEEHVNIYFARQLVSERLVEARERVPENFGTPEMLPVTTGLGEVYMFVLEGAGKSPMELREILDWEIAPRLRSVPGVIEVSAHGGFAKQFHVVVDPKRLVSFGIGIDQVFEALERSNAVAGGGYIEHAGEAYLIRASGLVEGIEDLRRIVVASREHTPITMGELGEVRLGSMPRLGAATADGEGEAVIAIVLMLKDANARDVATRVDAELRSIQRSLPEGVRIEPFYDRADLVNRVIRTVRNNLLEGALLVVAVLLLLLGSFRGGLLVASAIPLSMLVAFGGMVAAGISGNLMSLGAIDFGLLVDGAVVMVENMLRRSAHARERGGDIQEAMLLGAREVARPVAFGVGIILLVYIPILTLQGTEGKMFRPMALTVMFAVAAALVLALTLIPAATTLALPRGGNEKDTWLLRKIRGAYEPTLDLCLRRPWLTAAVAAAVFAASLGVLPFLGSEFIPRLDEGDLVIQAWRLPSISLEESVRTTLEIEKTLKRFPEVRRVISRTGTPEVATDVMGMELSDIFVNLRPPSEWTTARDKEELIEKMREALEREVPGVGFGFTQPIEMRFNELIAGVRSDVALKIFGDDLDELRVAAGRAAAVLSRIPGAEDVRVEQTAGQSVVSVRVDRARIARHGLDDERVLRAVEAAGAGRVVGRVFEGRRQFDLVVRLAGRDGQASGPQALADVPIAAGEAGLLPLGQLASVEIEDAPAQVSREAASRRIVIECNVRGRDLGSFVEEARAAIEREVPLPPGYFTRWGGQFENLERGRARLFVAVPIALMLIFALLYLAFGSARPALLVYVNVPLAATGGLLALAARGMPLSISAGVGFIALFGVAVLNGVVMISHVRRLSAQGVAPGEAARQGAMDRLRPVLMTALVASFGFVPMAISTSAGAEVQRPLATVVIGGLVTSTLLTLLVLPAIYKWFSERRVEVAA
jgi:cobalt-zinc-cadmium resistance protein CzcA